MKHPNTRFWNKYRQVRPMFTTYYMMCGCTVEVWGTNMFTNETSWKFTQTFATVRAAFECAQILEREYHALYVRDFTEMEV